MMTKDEILSKLTELKPILYKEYAVKEIGLFGSYSDELQSEDSDIDILIELEIPWSEMYLLRNKVTHEYFGIDHKIIWDVASNYLPKNRVQIEDLINKKMDKM